MFEIDKAKFGAFVAQLRKEKGLMQKELAEKLYVSDKAVSKWERGLSIPDVALLVPLADILGVTVTELLECRRMPKDEPIEPYQTEEIVKKVIGLSEEELKKYRPDRRKRGLQLLLCVIIGCVELWLLTSLGYSLEVLSVNLFAVMGMMAGFGLYFCVFTKEKLPKYYDDNRISVYSDGPLRMNLPGVYFNNNNWPYIVRAGQLWAMIGLVSAPVLFAIMNKLFESIWHTAGIIFILVLTLGGLFFPICYVGRKYEFAPEDPRPVRKNYRDGIWIGVVVLIVLVLVMGLQTSGGFSTGSGLRVMWSEQKTMDTWSAQYAYHDGYQLRTINSDDEPTVMDLEIVTTEGTIGITITDADGSIVFERQAIQTSSFSVELPGKVQVRIDSDGHKGSYALSW